MGCPSRSACTTRWCLVSVQDNNLMGLRSCWTLPVQGRGWKRKIREAQHWGTVLVPCTGRGCWSCRYHGGCSSHGPALAVLWAQDSSPVPVSSASPCNKTALRWNRERFHMRCGFSWLERARVEGRGRILLFVSSLLPLAIFFCNWNL